MRAIREVEARLPVFVCSGCDPEETSARFEDVRVDGFIQKPYSTATLLRHLQPLLDLG